ncbi:hypothetical protein OQJ46_03765 [Microbulbifer thermotolerans]|uniref:hypothetical protein n=1 Tax=Microbulbifer thermotolerans TaxID=252514 RepID=UPI00224B8B3A|nr:hypothetical protein [Microbulbifer thermotolerans]MCX2782106.1 hypothetical protein [Microbulbifer thermotolerans]
MKKKFIYRVSKYAVDDIPRGLLKSDWISSSLLIGLRLEDLKSPVEAQEAGFNKVGDKTYVREAGGDIEFSIEDMRSLFISSYIFQSERDKIFDFDKKGREIEKYIRDLIVGPLNQLKRKKENIEIAVGDGFYTGVDRIFMLDSMEPIVLVLDKEVNN